jgi:ubiquinone/menaquinone biosynthesis C-methylase UbiE
MNEYDRIDAAFYDYYSTGLEGDVEFYVEEAKKSNSSLLELGCGTGRILIPIAQAGINIVGLDHAPSMLEVARIKISKLNGETQHRIELVEGDMRNFSLSQKFKLVIIPYRAFLHLLTVDDQKQALNNIREHLSDDGRLIFNIFDPRLDFIVAHSGVLGSAPTKDTEFIYPETGNRVIVWDTVQFYPEQQIIDQYFIFEELNNEGKVISKTYSKLILRYIYRYEMEHLLEIRGYKIKSLYGDFKRGPFKYGGEQIWVVSKK